MKLRYKKIKNEEAYNIVRNNNNAILSVCMNGKARCVPIYYDTDVYCGCLKLYFEVCKCGDATDAIMNNDEVCISVMCGNTTIVSMDGEIRILPEEVDCCCNPIDDCTIRVEFTPNKMIGKRYYNCNCNY